MCYIRSYNDFVAQFAPHQPPELLLLLFMLEQQDPDKVLAEGFYLRCMDKSGLRGYMSPETANK